MMSRARPTGIADPPADPPTETPQRVVGFRLGRWDLATPVELLSEVWPQPRLAVVPRTAPWLLGVANYRGRLLCVVDLLCYLTERPSRVGTAARLLVVDRDPILCGLLVEEVRGLKRVAAERDNTIMADADASPRLRAGMAGCWAVEGERWWYWDPSSLVAQPEFARAAALPGGASHD